MLLKLLSFNLSVCVESVYCHAGNLNMLLLLACYLYGFNLLNLFYFILYIQAGFLYEFGYDLRLKWRCFYMVNVKGLTEMFTILYMWSD